MKPYSIKYIILIILFVVGSFHVAYSAEHGKDEHCSTIQKSLEKGHTSCMINHINRDPSKLSGILNMKCSEGWTLLHLLASDNDALNIKNSLSYIKNIKDRLSLITCQTNKGHTPLHAAARNGHAEPITVLLDSIEQIEQKDILSVLKIKTKDNWTLFHYLARQNDAQNIKKSLSYIKNIKDRLSLITCQTNQGDTSLHLASLNGHAESITVLLDNIEQKDIPSVLDMKNSGGWTLLHLLASDNDAQNIKNSLSYIKNIKDRLSLITCQDNEGYTPLHAAAHNGHAESITVLLDSIEQKDIPSVLEIKTKDNWALLHYLARQNDAQNITRCLGYIKNIKDRLSLITCQDNEGDTPLHLASLNGHTECIKVLLNSVLEKDIPTILKIKNKSGTTAVLIAGIYGEIESLLFFATHLGSNQSDIFDKAKINGYTVFHVAAGNGYDISPLFGKITPEFLTQSTEGFGFTFLQCVIFGKNNDALRNLLTYYQQQNVLKENIDKKDAFFGITALTLAVLMQDETMASSLLEFGAKKDAKSDFLPSTPSQLAQCLNNQIIKQQLPTQAQASNTIASAAQFASILLRSEKIPMKELIDFWNSSWVKNKNDLKDSLIALLDRTTEYTPEGKGDIHCNHIHQFGENWKTYRSGKGNQQRKSNLEQTKNDYFYDSILSAINAFALLFKKLAESQPDYTIDDLASDCSLFFKNNNKALYDILRKDFVRTSLQNYITTLFSSNGIKIPVFIEYFINNILKVPPLAFKATLTALEQPQVFKPFFAKNTKMDWLEELRKYYAAEQLIEPIVNLPVESQNPLALSLNALREKLNALKEKLNALNENLLLLQNNLRVQK